MELKNDRASVGFVLNIVGVLDDRLPQDHHLKNQIQATRLNLRFFKMFLWGLEHWKEGEEEESGKVLHPGGSLSVRTMIENEFRQIAEELKARIKRKRRSRVIRNWKVWVSRISEKIKLLKPQLIETCVAALSGGAAIKFESPPAYTQGTGDFIDFILENLGFLELKLKTNLIAPVTQQIGFIRGKLKLFQDFLQLVAGSMIDDGELDQLLLDTRTWADHISCLVSLYWISEMDESLASAMGTMLSDLMRKTMPPEVVALYLNALKATRHRIFHAEKETNAARIGSRYVEFLLESLDIPVKDETDEILGQGLAFLYSVVMDPPDEEDSQILRDVNTIIGELPSVFSSIHLDGRKSLFQLLEKIDRVRAEVRALYVLIPHSSQFNSPRMNPKAFIDFLLGNLKKMFEWRRILSLVYSIAFGQSLMSWSSCSCHFGEMGLKS